MKTAAIEAAGISELADRIDEHFNYLKEKGLIRQRLKRRAEMEIANIAKDVIERDVEKMKKSEAYKKFIEEIIEKKTDSHSAVDEILKIMKKKI